MNQACLVTSRERAILVFFCLDQKKLLDHSQITELLLKEFQAQATPPPPWSSDLAPRRVLEVRLRVWSLGLV